jgi:hypothetical protein
MMDKKVKTEINIWLIYFVTLFFSVYIHEIGHCIPAWINGYRAVPTPAKEYVFTTIPGPIAQYISLGGIVGTVVFSLTMLIIFSVKPNGISSALLAGAIAMPGMYTLRFILAGRGHDATEFQEVQAALGFNYSGHSLDWFFLLLFLAGAVIWIYKSKPRFKIIGRLFIGFILTFIFVAGLQTVNNLIFDPVFQTLLIPVK